MDLAEKIKELALPMLADSQFIVEVMVSSRQGPGKILVIVDGDQGVGIDDCAAISRQLAKILDEEGVMENYMLEVSTPGVEHPLRFKRQYRKNVGRNLKLKLHDTILEGKLSEVQEDKVVLTVETGSGKKKESKNIEVPFTEIEKAFVLVSFK